MHLVPDVFLLFPVETAAAGLFLHGKGLEDGWHRVGDARHHGLVASLFPGLDQFPGIGDLLGRGGAVVAAEHVGMTEDHLFADLGDGISDVEISLFLGDAGIENHVVHQVSDLLADLLRALPDDGVTQFIHLFLRHRSYRLHRLGGVPRAFLPQFVHDVEQARELGCLFFFGMHQNNSYL